MKSMVILPNEMFDDGGLESKCFMLGCESETYYVEIDNDIVTSLIGQIKYAIENGKESIDVEDLCIVYEGRHFDDPLMYITWD